MDKFAIEVDGTVHDELMTVSPKGVSLIELLMLTGGRPVKSTVLVEELWRKNPRTLTVEQAEKQLLRAKNRLKVLVSRTREYLNLLSPQLGECIVSVRGAYAWQMSTDVDVDLNEILSLCSAIIQAPSFNVEQWDLAEKLIRLYGTGLYLNSEWRSGPEKAFSLHEQYLQAVICYLQSLERRGDYLRVYTVCRDELKKDPDNQDLIRIQTVSRARLEEKQIKIPEELTGDRMSSQFQRQGKVREVISEDTAEILRSLPAVEKVTSKNVIFTQEFKDFFTQEYEKGRDAWEILRAKGVDPELLGWGRITGLCATARRSIRRQKNLESKTGKASRGNDFSRMSRRIVDLENEIDYLKRKLEVLERKKAIQENGESVLHSAGGR